MCRLVDGRRNRIDKEFAMSFAVFITKTEEETFVQAIVELEGGANAAGQAKSAVACCYDLFESRRASDNGEAVRGKLGDSLCRERREDRDVQRNLVVEQTDTAAEDGAIILGGSENKSDTRCTVQGLNGVAVMFEPNAKIKGEARVDLPIVLRKDSERVLCDG